MDLNATINGVEDTKEYEKFVKIADSVRDKIYKTDPQEEITLTPEEKTFVMKLWNEAETSIQKEFMEVE